MATMLTQAEQLPPELLRAWELHPDQRERCVSLGQQGYGLVITRRSDIAPEVEEALWQIATRTQEGTRVGWLPRFLQQGEAPVVNEHERQSAEAAGVDLLAAGVKIRQWAHGFVSVALVDGSNRGIGEAEREHLSKVNQAVREAHRERAQQVLLRVVEPSVVNWRAVVLRAIFLTGPLTQLALFLGQAVGFFVAVLADMLLLEGVHLWRVQQQGESWRRTAERLTVVGIAVVGAIYFSLWSASLLARHQVAWSGEMFGLALDACIVLALQQAWQRFRTAFRLLEVRGKLVQNGSTPWRLTWHEWFLSRAVRLRIFLLFLMPVMCSLIFLLIPGVVTSGWGLVGLGLVPSVLIWF